MENTQVFFLGGGGGEWKFCEKLKYASYFYIKPKHIFLLWQYKIHN